MNVASPPPEKEVLLGHLAAHRAHVLGILEDLDDEALRRPVLPSGWSCLQLVGHLTADDERFWFCGTVAGEPSVAEEVAAGADGWQVDPDVPAAEVLDAYRRQCDRSDEILTSTDLDAPPAWWPDELFGAWRLDSVRAIAMHVLSETAVHAGHLDAAREVLDGRQWLVLG